MIKKDTSLPEVKHHMQNTLVTSEEPSLSYHAPKKLFEDKILDNRLIFGDNLLALKALEQEFAGKIKCIYIDPPYNTGNNFEHYNDKKERSLWLNEIKQRITILWGMLTEDGVLAVQIDDKEYARLYLVLCEVCGEKNLKTIVVKMSEPSGIKMASAKHQGVIPKLKEYLILCKKDGVRGFNMEKVANGKVSRRYNLYLEHITKEDKALMDNLLKETVSDSDIELLDAMAKKIKITYVAKKLKELNISAQDKPKWLLENAWRICLGAGSSTVLSLARAKQKYRNQNVFFVKSKKQIAYMVDSSFSTEVKKPRVQLIFAEDNLATHPCDLWTDIKTTGLGGEGVVDFKNGKKPEFLLKRIIGMCTKEGDIVLDCYAGSGTTGAVAHKMGRRWVMVELGEHCHTHIIPRLKKVIDGTDLGGISKAVNWQGDGGFRYYKLADTATQNTP